MRFTNAIMRRLFGVATTLVTMNVIACSGDRIGPMDDPPLMPPPAPSVRITRIADTAMLREPAVGDSLALRAIFYDFAGKSFPGRPVTWSITRQSPYYAVSSDGIVTVLKAGNGASFTNVRAVIDGVVGEYPMSYRVLGWALDSTFNITSQRYELVAQLAASIPQSNPPVERRKGLNSDKDAIFGLRCRTGGGLELTLMLPEKSQSGDVQLRIRNASAIAERWSTSPDGYTLTRSGDASQLLGQLTTPRDFSLQYRTASASDVSGWFPGRDAERVVERVVRGCG